MSDEDKNVDNQNTSTDDHQNDSPTDGVNDNQDNLDDNSQNDDGLDNNLDDDGQDDNRGDDQDDDNQDDSDGDDTEHWDSEEEYLNQYSLPGSPKTLDEVMKSYKDLLPELNELQRQKADKNKTETKTTTDKPFFGTNLVMNTVDETIKSGSVPEKEVAGVRAWAKTIDNSLNPTFDKIGETLNGYASVIMGLIEAQQESAWNNFQHKNNVKKEEFFRYYGIKNLNPEKALHDLILSERPDLFNIIAETSFKKGKQQGKKKIRRFNANRKSKNRVTSSSKSIYKNYLTPSGELDEAKLNRINEKGSVNKLDVVNAFIKDQEAAMKNT